MATMACRSDSQSPHGSREDAVECASDGAIHDKIGDLERHESKERAAKNEALIEQQHTVRRA